MVQGQLTHWLFANSLRPTVKIGYSTSQKREAGAAFELAVSFSTFLFPLST
jgi:hypothetical protein